MSLGESAGSRSRHRLLALCCFLPETSPDHFGILSCLWFTQRRQDAKVFFWKTVHNAFDSILHQGRPEVEQAAGFRFIQSYTDSSKPDPGAKWIFTAASTTSLPIWPSFTFAFLRLERSGREIYHFLANDERMHHYQRRRTSIIGLMVELR